MPISVIDYNSTTLRYTTINVTYVAGDPKGDTALNPWRMQDIIDTAIADAWAIQPTKVGNYYYINYRLVLNAGSFFEVNSETVEFFDAATAGLSVFVSVLNSVGNLKVVKSQLIAPFNRPRLAGIYDIDSSLLRFGWLDGAGGTVGTRNLLTNSYLGDARVGRIYGFADIKNSIYNGTGTIEINTGVNNQVYENCLITGTNAMFFNGAGTITFEKLYFNSTTGGIGGNVRLGSGTITLLDCRFPINKFTTLSGTTDDGNQDIYYNQSVRFFGDENIDIEIYDKNDNLVKDLSKGSAVLEDVLTATYVNLYSPTTGGVVTTVNVYEPYRIVISKSGYETQEINDVYLSEENPSVVDGRMGKVTPTDFIINLKKAIPLMITPDGMGHPKANRANYGKNREILL